MFHATMSITKGFIPRMCIRGDDVTCIIKDCSTEVATTFVIDACRIKVAIILSLIAPLRSAGTHQRSILFPTGNERYGFVKAGNRLAARFTLIILYSMAMGCRWLLEQPGGCVLCLHPRLQSLFHSAKIFVSGFWGGAYASSREEATPKRHVVYSNDCRLLREISMAAGHLTRSQLEEFNGAPLTKRQKRPDGSIAWSGNGETLTQSQLGPQLLFTCFS